MITGSYLFGSRVDLLLNVLDPSLLFVDVVESECNETSGSDEAMST